MKVGTLLKHKQVTKKVDDHYRSIIKPIRLYWTNQMKDESNNSNQRRIKMIVKLKANSDLLHFFFGFRFSDLVNELCFLVF